MASVRFAAETAAPTKPSFAARSFKSGYLMKRNNMKVWQKRWFVLDKGEISYYRNFEQFKRQMDGEYSHPIPCCGRVKKRGSKQGTEEFEVHHHLSAVMEEDEEEVDHDIDFVVIVDGEKMLLRGSSAEEKKAWLMAMNSATLVKSYSSRHLNLSENAPVSWPNMSLADLDMGEILGSGTTGTVKLAVHIPTGMRCAVKIIAKRKFFFNKQLEESTKREIEILDRMMEMNHNNIVKCFGHIDKPAYIYIVMELCEGGELLEQLEHIGKYTEEDTSEVVRNLIETLGYLHSKGIVHRDIKPENLLLADSTDLCNIKIADFGLANIMEGGSGLDTVCGSPAYMAPEILSSGEYSEACDLWSVGVMMYLMLCGFLPFQGANSAEKMANEKFTFDDAIWDQVSAGAKNVIRRLLKADPRERLTCEQALQHPWVTGEETGHEWLEDAQRKIILFNAKRKFKGIVHAIIASNRMKNLLKGLSAAKENIAAEEEGSISGSPSNGRTLSSKRSIDVDTKSSSDTAGYGIGFKNSIADEDSAFEAVKGEMVRKIPGKLAKSALKRTNSVMSLKRSTSADLSDSMMGSQDMT